MFEVMIVGVAGSQFENMEDGSPLDVVLFASGRLKPPPPGGLKFEVIRDEFTQGSFLQGQLTICRRFSPPLTRDYRSSDGLS
jgi:hypothetical protein